MTGSISTTPCSISVIVCAYTLERWDALVSAIASLHRQTLPPAEIILVIDHNPQLLARAQAQFLDAQVIANQGPSGLSGARNSGIQAAGGEIFAFMDEDASAESNWLEKLAACYTDPSVLGVGGRIAPNWQSQRPGWMPEEFLWVVGCSYRGMPETVMPVRNLIGCNMSIRKEVFQTAGLFRSGIGRVGKTPLGCEETELCIRASQRIPDGIFLYQPEAVVHHLVPATRTRWGYYAARTYSEGISKALVANLVGAQPGLASERAYTLRVLPSGVANGFKDALKHREPAGVLRSAAIVLGLMITTAGYAVGKITQLIHPAAAAAPLLAGQEAGE